MKHQQGLESLFLLSCFPDFLTIFSLDIYFYLSYYNIHLEVQMTRSSHYSSSFIFLAISSYKKPILENIIQDDVPILKLYVSNNELQKK